MESPLDNALHQFDSTAANLARLERLWDSIEKLIPEGISYFAGGQVAEAYEDYCRAFRHVLTSLPAIDGWRPADHLMELNVIAQSRYDAREIGELDCIVSADAAPYKQSEDLREYRFRLGVARRALTRFPLLSLLKEVDADLKRLPHPPTDEMSDSVAGEAWDALQNHVGQIDILLGDDPQRPGRWSDLRRHLRFGLGQDLVDIKQRDWPSVKSAITPLLNEGTDPLPVETDDLATLIQARPKGPVATKLNWEVLTPEDFERLLYGLISTTEAYENAEWLTSTNAPDRGRDLSVACIRHDKLCGTQRERVIIQCKHWLSKSISLYDVTGARDQMPLWEPPRVDVLVIATSGRFTTDAVACIEKHNQSNAGMRIVMWPESHLELLLAARPDLIAEFRLR
jgi:hypothetical protein